MGVFFFSGRNVKFKNLLCTFFFLTTIASIPSQHPIFLLAPPNPMKTHHPPLKSLYFSLKIF